MVTPRSSSRNGVRTPQIVVGRSQVLHTFFHRVGPFGRKIPQIDGEDLLIKVLF